MTTEADTSGPRNYAMDAGLCKEIAALGAKDMELCMQCATCSASCPLSTGSHPFPRKIYRYLQLGLRDKLLESSEPWLCYYCGECNADCPRGAEPAETMMAARRWLTTQYDWTGLARRFYLSKAWELGALGLLASAIILLFCLFHGPIITDRVSVNTFVPVLWIEIGDLTMGAVLSMFLLSNAFRMFRFIMGKTRVPLSLYLTEAKTFILHFMTQRRWRQCGEDKHRWLKHFILVTGYLTMMTLIIVFIRWFQVDDASWHFTSIFGYYASGVLLVMTVEMFISRLRREETIHRFSHLSDWLFLILLFLTTLTGIVMHAVRIAGWPMATYVMYVIHLAVAVPMLVIEVPFGKWSHLFYRPLALFLTTVKEKAETPSVADSKAVTAAVNETFMSCLQCGTCSGICPWNQNFTSTYSPRQILRQIALNTGTEHSVDQAAWHCVTCNACDVSCPRGIEITDVVRSVRRFQVDTGSIPERFLSPRTNLTDMGNPWGGSRKLRRDWEEALEIPDFSPEHEYCLYTCCTTIHDASPDRRNWIAGQALPRLLDCCGIAFGTLGLAVDCCGDPAYQIGDQDLFRGLVQNNTDRFLAAGVKRILTTSPHCLNLFRNHYDGLKQTVRVEHYTVLLDRLILKGRLTPTRSVDRLVTYHDPCTLGRRFGIYDEPRRILHRIPGLTLVEMANHKESSQCCGGGGGGAWNEEPEDKRLGGLRVEEAMATGAEVIATACPYCLRILNSAVVELGVTEQIKVCDLSELLLMSMDGEAIEGAALDSAGIVKEGWNV